MLIVLIISLLLAINYSQHIMFNNSKNIYLRIILFWILNKIMYKMLRLFTAKKRKSSNSLSDKKKIILKFCKYNL